jgi:hypothetical protein
MQKMQGTELIAFIKTEEEARKMDDHMPEGMSNTLHKAMDSTMMKEIHEDNLKRFLPQQLGWGGGRVCNGDIGQGSMHGHTQISGIVICHHSPQEQSQRVMEGGNT